MNRTPNHWQMKSFEEIREDIDKGGPEGDGKFDYIEISSIDNERKVIEDVRQITPEEASSRAKQRLKAGDVLISKVRPALNGVAIVPEQYGGAIGTTGFYVVRSKEVIPKFIFYFVQRNEFIQDMDDIATGSSYPSVRIKDIEKYELPVPPVKEQRQLVEKIEEYYTKLDVGVRDLKTSLQQLDQYHKSTLQAAITGELTESWRDSNSGYRSGDKLLQDLLNTRRKKWEEKYKELFKYRGKDYDEPSEPETENLHTLPEDWTWGSIEQISYVVGGLTKNKSKRDSYSNEVPYLRVANVYPNRLELDQVKKIRVSDREMKTKLLQKGDLLLVEGNGSKDQIGRVAMWDGSIEPCSHQNHLIKVRILNDDLRKFALYWLLSDRGRKRVTNVASSTSGLHTLSLTKVRNIPVPIPPIEEAKQIVNSIEQKLSVRDQVEDDLREEMDRALRLRQAILEQAFSGDFIETKPEPDTEQPNEKSNKELTQATLEDITNDD